MQSILKVIEKFDTPDEIKKCEPFGRGHINDTYLVSYNKNDTTYKYILRKINRSVFKNPQLIVENTLKITDHIEKKIHFNFPRKQILKVKKTITGDSCFIDSNNDFWCMINFIENSYSVQLVDSTKKAFEAAKAYGDFLRNLWDFDISNCYETIKDFHNLKNRIHIYNEAIKKDPANRVKEVNAQIESIQQYNFILDKYEKITKENLPLRITHNDTKIDNILFDKFTDEAVCVVDLDTVMPGYVINDFGDMVRTFTPSINENQKDAAESKFRLEIFESMVKGYLGEVGHLISYSEIDNLVNGSLIITYEQAVRFLTDYIMGDIYYKTKYEDQNLTRTKNQLLLLRDLVTFRDEMEKIIKMNLNS